MSIYQIYLPSVFPWLARIPADIIDFLVEDLVDRNRTDVEHGSSFAVTVENTDGTVNLWLSDASYQYLNPRWILNELRVQEERMYE